MDHQSELELSPQQVADLEAVRVHWDAQSRLLRQQVADEADRLQQVMASRAGRGIDLQHLSENAEPVTDYSGRLAAVRRSAWNDASGSLAPAVKRRIERTWALHLAFPAARGSRQR